MEPRFIIKVFALLMQLEQEDIPYATLSNGPMKEAHFFPYHYNPGVRVGFGWDGLKAVWDYIPSEAHAKKLGTAITPSFNDTDHLPALAPTNQRIEASWKGALNQLDLYLDNPFCNERFHLLLGIRGAYLYQHIVSDYFRSGDNLDVHLKNRLKNIMDGVGPLSGFEIYWNLGEGFNLIGTFKGSLLYRHSSLKSQAFNIEVINGISSLYTPSRSEKCCGLQPVFDLSFGVDYTFCYSSLLFRPYAAWKHHLYWDQLHYYGLSAGLDLLF